MDPLRETGKLLIVLGIVLAGVGALLCVQRKIAVSARAFAGRYRLSGTQWQFLFSDRDVHSAERGFEFADVDCESFPPIELMSQTSLFNLMPERRTWKVSELTARIRELLESALPDVWVEGEVSNCHAAQSGHCYFTLKDAKSQIRCVCFRDQMRGMKFKPEDGLHITVRGALSVYDARGEYQIYVTLHRASGVGRAATGVRAAEKKAGAGRIIRGSAQETAAGAAALHRGDHFADRRGDSRHLARAEAPISQRAGELVSSEGAGRGSGGGNRGSAAIFQSREDGGRADSDARRRLARRFVGVQRGNSGARDFRVARFR